MKHFNFYIKSIAVLGLAMLVLASCSDDDTQGTNNVLINGDINSVTTIGGSNNDSARSVVSTSDGGYAILGYTQSNDGDITPEKLDESFDFWVLKYNQNDELDWQKTYGGSGDDRGRSIIQTSDSGYAILGYTQSNDGDVTQNNGFQDYWLAKLDNAGNLSWQKSFGFIGQDYGISVIQTSDQGYMITGVLDVTSSNGQGNTSRNSRHAGGDYWALKLDVSGNLQWSRYFGGNFTDTPEGVVETPDGSFIIAGGSDSVDTDITDNKGSYDFWVIKISSTGDLIWEKSFGGDQIDEARAIAATSDGHFIIAGDTRSNNIDVSANNGNADMWLVKITDQGIVLWEKTFGGTSFDVARAITPSRNGGFLVAGSSRSSDIDVTENMGQNDAWVIKVNEQGSIQWQQTVGGSDIDFAYGIAELTTNTVIAVGDSTSSDGDITENKGFTDALIIKID